MRSLPILFALCLPSFAKHRVPVLELEGSDAYRGTWKAGVPAVTLTPPIRALPDSGRICGYVVVGEALDALPFAVRVTDEESGAGEVLLKEGLTPKCDASPFTFTIQAKRCGDGALSQGATVVVSVEWVNSAGPELGQPWYSVEVEEGRLYNQILQLSATDPDCGKFGEVCRYEITNNAAPFEFNQQGWLRNTEPLNFSKSHSHILSVKAHDCGMKQSKEVLVTVKVNRVCKSAINGIPERVEYAGGSGRKVLGAEATLGLCGLDSCEVERVEGRLSLETQHIARGCDRDSFTSPAQRQRCNVDPGTVDLLPNPINLPEFHPEASDEKKPQAADNQVLQDQDSDQVYFFDGEQNAIVVGDEVTKPDIPGTFTLSFWMKHERSPKTGNHFKENIICNSDDHRMNRHHFAVYLRNCKLEMLYRTEKVEGEENKFRAAEWRWSAGQVCDNNWHHYTVSFANPQADLFVDGLAFPTTESNPEILDDWPMHATGLKTKLTVGACWHGRNGVMEQFFKGYVSNLLYLPGKVEHPGVLQCLHQCKEQLQFPPAALSSLLPHQEVVFAADDSELTLRTNSAAEFETLLRQVAYVNLRAQPTPGHRPFTISTALKCKGSSDPLTLPETRGFILVHKTPAPRLTLSAAPVIIRTVSEAKAGTSILPDLKIRVETQAEGGEWVETTSEHKLSWCHIQVDGGLQKDAEYFSSPAALIQSFNLDFKHDTEGLMLNSLGGEKVKAFQEVLDQIHYFATDPQVETKRKFSVQCGMLGGESVKSPLLPVSLGIQKDAAPVVKPAEEETKEAVKSGEEIAAEEEKKTDDQMEKLKALVLQDDHIKGGEAASARLASVLEADQPKIMHQPSLSNMMVGEGAYAGAARGSAMAGGAVAMVVVVCIGFLLVVIVVGILRMRDAPGSRRGKGKRLNSGDMEWDDSGMNIIVNPIEGGKEVEEGKVGVVGEDDYSEEDSSDGDSYRDDEELSVDGSDDDEEMNEVLPHCGKGRKGLEWDDSTLHPTGGRAPKAHTYRV